MEEANDADGPNSGRKAHKKKILIIEDSDDDSVISCEPENNQLTSKRKSNQPPMEGIMAESTSEGSDDSSDDLESENSGTEEEEDDDNGDGDEDDESSDEASNASNSDHNSDWTTDSEEDDGIVTGVDEDSDMFRPSTSRARPRRSRRLVDSLSDEQILSGDELTPQRPAQSSEVHADTSFAMGEPSSGRLSSKRIRVDVENAPKDRDNFQGSSSETDDGEGPKTRCPICLRSLPGPSSDAEVGSPEGCQHSFCVCCIQEWAKNVNTCPVDRHEFSEIVVYEGVGGKEVRRLPLTRGTWGIMDVEDITLISQIEEDPTFCEVCGSGDREDSLLLCDGCDRGYHLDCLTPPLTSVPIEEWFCSTCTGTDASRQRGTRATRNMRLLPRTSVSQRVLRSLRRDAFMEQGRRGLRTWNIDSRDLELMEEMAELEVERRWAENTATGRQPSTSRGPSTRRRVNRRRVYRKRTTRKKRKTVTKKRLVKKGGEEEEEEEVEEEEVTTTSRRRRGKRRKGAGKRRGKKRLSKKKGRSRLAETLGIVQGKKGILLKKKGMCGRGGAGGAQGIGGGADGGAVINGTASSIGGRVPMLSIFGSRNDLEYFSDGSDVEGGGGSLAVASIPRPVDSVHAHQLAKERLISSIGSAAERRKALIKERALASSSPSCGSGGGGVPDILGTIMESQSVWHGRKSKVKINSDGSLVVEKSKTSSHSQDRGRGDSPAVGPKSIETTNINNEMNVNSGAARVPSNPTEPSTTAQDSCSTFRDGNSGVEVRDSAASVETREAIDTSVRPIWPVRTLDADLREESSSANRKDRLPSQNVNETHYANRAPSTTTAQSIVTTSSRATNNFRSIEHLAGNVIVNSNRNYVDATDDGRPGRLWESQPASSVKNDRSVISSGFVSHVSPMSEGDILSGGSFGLYGFSPNSPLDLSSSSHKGDARELLHRNMYLDLSSGGGGGDVGFGPMGYGAPYAGVSCEAVDMRVQSLPNASAIAEDLRVPPSSGVVHPHIRSLSVIKENPSIEPGSRSFGGGPLHRDLHANIGERPLPPSERVGGSVVTPLEAVNTIGLPGSSGNGSSNQSINSSVRDMGGGDRASNGGGGAREGTNQRLDYARANSSYGSETSDANGSGNEGSGGGGGGGDRNNRPQLLKRHLDEDEEDEEDKEDREEGEDEDVDIYSDIEPGGSDPPIDTIPERHGVPVHVIETPPGQGPMFHPSLQTSGSDKYDPAEPSYDTDDEMVIDEEGGNDDESHTPRSASLEGEVPPPPPLPPSLMDSIAKSPEELHGYDRERSVTPTEEDERRKAAAIEDPEGMGRPPVGVRVYGILSQGKFGLGVNAYGSDDEDEDDDEGCPNFSIYSATSVNIARTVEAEEEPKKESKDPTSLSEKVDESLNISHKSSSPSEEMGELENQWNADQSMTDENPPSLLEEDSIPVAEKNSEDFSSENEATYKRDLEKSDAEKSDVDDDPSFTKSDIEAEKSDVEADLEKSSDFDGDKSDDGAKTIDSKSLEESLPNEDEVNLDDGAKELSRDDEEEGREDEEREERGVDEETEGGGESREGEVVVNESERTRDIVMVPELEGLETETISEAEEASAFEDMEASKRRSCGGEEEEGEIVDDRARDKCIAGLVEKDVNEKDVEKDVTDRETQKNDEGIKKDGKKEGKRRTRKKVDASKSGDAPGGDAAIAWKKLSKLGKERNYREKGVEDPNQSKKELEDKEDKENRRGKKERDRRKGKRKDLERYDVRKVVGERSKTKRRRTDAFGRELRSNSKSRSRSRLFSRSRSRGVRSRSRGGRSRSPRGRSRSRGARSRSRGIRSRSRGRRSRSRGGRSRSRNSRSRLPSKSRGRSRSRGKGRRSRSRSRVRQRSRSRGIRSRSRGARSRSRQRGSRDRVGRRGENASNKTASRKKGRRSRSPVSERRKQSRSRSRQRKRSRSRSRRRRAEHSQGSWERSWTRSWSRSVTPIQSRSLEKTRGHMRSRSMSGSRVLRDRSPMPMSRSPSRSRGRSFCRSPSTPTLPPPPRGRMGLQSISCSPSRSPERLRSPAMAAVGAGKKKRRKKEGRVRKEVEVGGKKRKKRRERSPAASKEVFASGDNILVSVSFKSAPKENSNVPKRRKASSPVEEKVKVLEESAVDPGLKKKRKFMPVIKKKPSVIIDLETSPFVERVPSPADLIVLSDSSGEHEDKGSKQQQQQQEMNSDIQRRHRMMMMSPVQGQKSRGIGVKEKRAGGKVGKKGKLGGKGKKALGKKDRKVAVAASIAAPSEVVPLEEPPLPLSVPEEPPLERRLGPKTPPEPQVKFCIASKGSQLRSVNNPLREDDDEDEEDEIIASEAIAAATQLELSQKVMVQGEPETNPQDNGTDGELGESEVHQTVQVGPNTPPGPSTPDLQGQFNEVGERASPTAPQEETAVSSSSRMAGEEEVTNTEAATPFEEPPSRKDQEMDTYDPFEPTNSPAPSPPAPETEPLGHQNAEEPRDAPPPSAMAEGGASSSQAQEEQRPVEEEVAVAEPKAEEPTTEPTVEEAGPTPVQGSVQGVANIARTLSVGAIDAVGGLVLPLLAQLGAVAQPQPLNAAVAAVTSANSPIVQQQQQLSPLINRAFPQQPQQAKAADVIRTLFGTGLRQFPEMVASSGAGGAFSVTQPKVSKTDLSLGGGARGKGGPRVAVTAPRVAVATPRVVVPMPRVAITPRVATANGKDQPPGSGQDRVDVVDMDLESPYSPASSEGDDLFEPPSYESAGSARQTSVLGQQSQQNKGGMKGSQRSGSAPSQDKFDNLFGSSPMRRNSGGGKGQSRGIKNHKGGGKAGKQRGKTGGKVNVRSEEDHHLTILDELPNSAVEMQVKEKFLIKLNRQERVVEEVKLALKPHYNKKHLSKDEYKDILRRSVPKICHNRSGEINPIKIRSLVEAYVRKFRYARKKDSAATALTATTRTNKGKKPT